MNEQYVNPQELEEQGFRRQTGRCYKLNTLERYADAGYLDCGCFSVIDKVSAGNRLFADAYLGGVIQFGVADISRIRVDGCGKFEEGNRRLHHQDCYEKAMAAVPPEFWPVVRRVCIEDRPLAVSGARLFVKKELYSLRKDLCRGLDRLIVYYRENLISYLKNEFNNTIS